MTDSRDTFKDVIAVPIGTVIAMSQNEYGEIIKLVRSHNLRTNAGRDWQCEQMSGTAGGVAKYIGLSESTTAPIASDVVLAGELAADGLSRKIASYTHSAGARSFILTATWTVTGSRTIRKLGLFNNSAGGTLCFESTIPFVGVANGQLFSVFWNIDLGA